MGTLRIIQPAACMRAFHAPRGPDLSRLAAGYQPARLSLSRYSRVREKGPFTLFHSPHVCVEQGYIERKRERTLIALFRFIHAGRPAGGECDPIHGKIEEEAEPGADDFSVAFCGFRGGHRLLFS